MLDNSPVGIARNVKELQIPTLEKYWKTQKKKKKVPVYFFQDRRNAS